MSVYNFNMRSVHGVQKSHFWKNWKKRGGVVDGSSSELKKPKNLSFVENSKTQIYSYTSFEALKRKLYIYIYMGSGVPSKEGKLRYGTHIFLFMDRYSQTIA